MTQPTSHGKPWSKAEVKLLADHVNRGLTSSQIAPLMGRTATSIMGARNRKSFKQAWSKLSLEAKKRRAAPTA